MTVPPRFTDRTADLSADADDHPHRTPFAFTAADAASDLEPTSAFTSHKPVQYSMLARFQHLPKAS